MSVSLGPVSAVLRIFLSLFVAKVNAVNERCGSCKFTSFLQLLIFSLLSFEFLGMFKVSIVGHSQIPTSLSLPDKEIRN